MEIQSDETIGQLVTRLEREAQERLTLVASIRKMMLSVPAVSRNGNSHKPAAKRSHRKSKRVQPPTLADNIVAVLKDSPRPMTQPEIRRELISRGAAINPKNPESAISTAMSRKEGKLFRRGEGFEWMLIGKVYEQPFPKDTSAVSHER